MGKATVEYPFTDICGKVNKSDSAYFCHRNGKTYIHRIKNPYTGAPTINQLRAQEIFKRVTEQTNSIIKMGPGSDEYDLFFAQWKANPGKYETLRGYIFAKLYSTI